MIFPIITRDTYAPTNDERRAAFRVASAGIERFQRCYAWPWLKKQPQRQRPQPKRKAVHA